MQINSWSAGQPWSCLLLHNGHPGCQETCLWLPNPGRWASAGLLDTLIYILKTSIISKYMSIWKLFNSWYLTIPYHALPYLTIPYHTLPITYLSPVTFWALFSGAPSDSCSPKNCMSWWPRCVDALASSQVGGVKVPENIWQAVLTIDSIVVNNGIKWSSEFFGK
jgi:hypothetical protein